MYRHHFPELTVERLPKNEEETDINVAYGEKNFRAHVKSVCIDELIQNSEMINTDIKGYFIQALYLFDETELREYMRKFEDETMVTGLLYLDNYDEALESVEEVRRSLLTALVERKINKYFNDLDGLVKRYENDKYIVVMRRSSLNELKEKSSISSRTSRPSTSETRWRSQSVWVSEQMLDRLRKTPSMRKSRSTWLLAGAAIRSF